VQNSTYVDVFAVNTSTQVTCNSCHCICSMHHVLICSCKFFQFISISCYPPSDTARPHQCTHITVAALQLYSLHKQFNHCTLKNMSLTATHFHSTLQQAHAAQTGTHKNNETAHSWELGMKNKHRIQLQCHSLAHIGQCIFCQFKQRNYIMQQKLISQ
jgi:hypothetical protein